MWIAEALQEIEIALTVLAVLGYAGVTLGCMAFTFAEGQLEGRGWDGWRMAGLMLCLLWPAIVLVFAATQFAGRRPHAA